MKKRFTSMLLAVIMVLSLSTTSTLAYSRTSDVAAIKFAAEKYLRTQMSRVYQWEKAKMDSPQTILTAEGVSTMEESSLALPSGLSESAKEFIESESIEVMESVGRRSITAEDMASDLQTMENYVLYRSYIFEDMNIAFISFDAEYYFDNIAINRDYAVVKVYESLTYQYTDSPDESAELNYYYLVMKKANRSWYVADVISDDAPYLAFMDDQLTASDAILSYESAVEFESKAESMPAILSAATNESDITYNVSNAVNYALMYTSAKNNPVNEGGQGSTSMPSFKNTRFYWFGSDCMNFASQCVWAGFGGSNNPSDINAKCGMDNSGTYTWWCTKQGGVGSWSSCSAFRSYVENSYSGAEKGLYCDTKETACNSSTINWNYAASDLVGSVMHVQGQNDAGKLVALGHAVFVNAANSLSRSDIFVCCYNSCKKNVKLGSYWSAGSGSTRKIVTIKPRSFIKGESGARIWGDWVPNVTATNNSRTLKGYGNQIFRSLTMNLINPNGSVVKTWNSKNRSVVTGTYSNWNSVGDKEWTIEITGITSEGKTVTWYGAVRVAKS